MSAAPERLSPTPPQVGRSLSLAKTAEVLGISPRTIYNHIREGKLQTIRTKGGSQRVLVASLPEWVPR